MSFPGFIGKKRGMTQIFDDNGNAVVVTALEVVPMTVTQLKSEQVDGYSAVQFGYQEDSGKHLTQGQKGHLKKSDLPLLRKLKEFRLEASALEALNLGDIINPLDESFGLTEGLKVAVQGTSIGKGFQGGTKRWGFSRGPMSHGSKSHRIPGSIGAGTTPGRVLKGKKMAGRMGNKTITTKNLKLVKILADKNVVLVQGSVPGVEGQYVTVRLPQGTNAVKSA